MASKQVQKGKKAADKHAGSAGDKFKWLVVIMALLGAVVANLYYASVVPTTVRAAIFLALLIGLLFLAGSTASGSRAWKFVKDARSEMRRVSWPTRQETLQTTLMIIVAVLITALFLWLFDSLFVYVVRLILSV